MYCMFYISMNYGHVSTSSKKNMLPVLEFHDFVYLFLTYMDSLYVEMVS